MKKTKKLRTIRLSVMIIACLLLILIGLNTRIGQSIQHKLSAIAITWPTTTKTTTKMTMPTTTKTTTPSTSLDVVANNAYVIQVGTDKILYQKESQERIAPASTTKMLTALTVLEHCSADDVVTVGEEIHHVPAGSSLAWLRSNDVLTVQQLLIALLLPSGNDAAQTLAVYTGHRMAEDQQLNDQEAVALFIEAMNQKAADLGATSSHFKTPDGYDAEGQYTTAEDLALFAKAVLQNKTLAKIVDQDRSNQTLESGREVTYTNTNELLNPSSPYYYPNAIGLKTGNSEKAGACLVSAATIDGETYLCVMMGGSKDSRFSDSLMIYEAIENRKMR